jgi:hypothetical protein
LTEIPLTDTSVSELVREHWQIREGVTLDDYIDHCSRRYRAGRAIGETADFVLSAIGMTKIALKFGRYPLQALFRLYGRGMESARDAYEAASGIRDAAEIAIELGGGFAEALDQP